MKTKITLLFLLFLTITGNRLNAQSNNWSATDKFRNCINSMQSTNDELTRFNFAMNFFLTEHSTTIQLQDAFHYLYSDQKKYELGVAAYPNIIDKDHFFHVYDAFSKFSWAIKLYHNTQEKQQIDALQNNYLNYTFFNNCICFLLIFVSTEARIRIWRIVYCIKYTTAICHDLIRDGLSQYKSTN